MHLRDSYMTQKINVSVIWLTRRLDRTAIGGFRMKTAIASTVPFVAFLSLVPSEPALAQATLSQFASLPADTFTPGPTSGQLIAPANGRTPPFDQRQPVQGISSVLRESNGDFLVMSDNGFGAKENSADYVLRVYRIAPDFRTKNGGSGMIDVESFITLSDPHRYVNFPIVADGTLYPNSVIPVDPAIRSRRLLTGGTSTSSRSARRPMERSGSATSSGRFFSTPIAEACCSRRRFLFPASSRRRIRFSAWKPRTYRGARDSKAWPSHRTAKRCCPCLKAR
jgi:hypothetical protein